MLHTSRIDSNRHETKFFFEIPQKMCCRGLDIRVPEVVEADVAQAVCLGKSFAVVFGEVMKGGRGKYLLSDSKLD